MAALILASDSMGRYTTPEKLFESAITQLSQIVPEIHLLMSFRAYQTVESIATTMKRRFGIFCVANSNHTSKTCDKICHSELDLAACLDRMLNVCQEPVIWASPEIAHQLLCDARIQRIYHDRIVLTAETLQAAASAPNCHLGPSWWQTLRPDIWQAHAKHIQLSQPAFSEAYVSNFQLWTLAAASGEWAYRELIFKIMTQGENRLTRNAATRQIFGASLRYDLQAGWPVTTLRQSYPRLIFQELMWMLRGETDTNILRKRNVNIWNANSSQEFLREAGLPYAEGDIGPGYGFQMRYAGATYVDCHTDYQGQGVDQLQACIQAIRHNPTSRRILLQLWNVADVDKMALPPCHVMYQFAVSNGKLNCHFYQRSWDVILGWNTATAALLVYLLAHHCELQPGELTHSIGDAHIYQSHIDTGGVVEMLNREPMPPCQLSFRQRHANITDYEFQDLAITDYLYHPAIKFQIQA